MTLNRVLALAVALLVILTGAIWGIRQYGNTRVAERTVEVLQEAQERAGQAQEAAVVLDAAQAKENVTKRDAVRRAVIKGKSENAKAVPDCVGDAERIRLLNLAIHEVNGVLAATSILPE